MTENAIKQESHRINNDEKYSIIEVHDVARIVSNNDGEPVDKGLWDDLTEKNDY